MAIMGFLAVANAYTMRVCLNIAITQMVRKNPHSAGNDGSCPAGDGVDISAEGSDPTVSHTLVLVIDTYEEIDRVFAET